MSCAGSFKIIPSESPGDPNNALEDVARISDSQAWAVGLYRAPGSNKIRTLIERSGKNGFVTVPSPKLVNAELNGVDTLTANGSHQAIAVGGGGINYPLVERWDGALWTLDQNVPHDGWVGLSDVDIRSSTDAWAVGARSAQKGLTYVMHSDGSSWTHVPSPSPSETTSTLEAVSAPSRTDAWAVGWYESSDASALLTLIEHWDGKSWSVVPSPNPGTVDNELHEVVAFRNGEAWAVGGWASDTGRGDLVLHWNGTSWIVVDDADPKAFTVGIAGERSDDVWIVGAVSRGGGTAPYAEHWDGLAWSVVPTEDGLKYSWLEAVAEGSPRRIWAVGTEYDHLDGPVQNLAERFRCAG